MEHDHTKKYDGKLVDVCKHHESRRSDELLHAQACVGDGQAVDAAEQHKDDA